MPAGLGHPRRSDTGESTADAVALVTLDALIKLSAGRPEIAIGLIDGPVMPDHPDLATAQIHSIGGTGDGTCHLGASCAHGTFVAGILAARRGSAAPAICPGCTLLLWRIFAESGHGTVRLPSATPDALAAAVIECVDAGARFINIGAALAQPSTRADQALEAAFTMPCAGASLSSQLPATTLASAARRSAGTPG
jgi:subtilisin family serine protease